jgi:8-oxo-dGTP pyrophosphatase MutT (NUDIX family)
MMPISARVASPAGTAILEELSERELLETQVVISPELYRVPQANKAAAEAFLASRLADRAHAFDGPVVGLAALQTDANGGHVATLQHGGYFSHLASDIGTEAVFGAAISEAARTRPPAETPLLHAIGVSAIALTRDNTIVMVRQSRANESSAGLLAPSGSGSLEPVDLHPTVSFGEVLLRGALREMHEELGLLATDISSMHLLGLARWLEKAGKPEALAVARLNVNAAEVLQRKLAASEHTYVAERLCLPLTPFATWHADEPESLLETVAGELSLPLRVGLHLLAARS